MVEITFLNSMAGADLSVAARRHRELGISILDLKDNILGCSVESLSPELAARAGEIVTESGCSVYCLSSCIGYTDLAEGEGSFADRHVASMSQLIAGARLLRPRAIRLLAPRTPPGIRYAEALAAFPWVISVYQMLVDMAAAGGYDVLLENEAKQCLLATPDDMLSFVAGVNRPASLKVIFDVQNMWQMGWFPTVASVMQLAPILGGFHLKGGRVQDGTELVWASPLETASWPVIEMTRAVIDLGTVPVICLNPSHGRKPPGHDVWNVGRQDLHFLRTHFPELQGHGLPA